MSVLDIHRPRCAVVRHIRLSDGTIVANEGLELCTDEAEAQRFCDALIEAGTPERDLEIVSFAARPGLAPAPVPAAALEPTATELADVRDVQTIPGPIASAAEVRARGFSVNRAYLDFLRDAHDEGDQERVGQMLRLMTAVERVVDDFSPAPLVAPESLETEHGAGDVA